MRTDQDLLHAVATARDADAFAQIVERYLGLVYGGARRQVDAAMAEDVTQAVFLLLWQRAKRMGAGATLAGWLVNATRLAALQAQRGEARRRRREYAAGNPLLKKGETVSSAAEDIAPLLDEALGHLAPPERSAVALRYLQDKSLAEVAAISGISEAAAAKRVSRGLGRLRRRFGKRGLAMTTVAIGLALQQHGRCSIPPTALGTQVLSNAAIGGHAVSMTIVKGVAATMTMQKVAAVAVAVVILLLVCGGGWFAFHGGSAAAPLGQGGGQAVAVPGGGGDLRGPPIQVGVVVSAHFASSRSYSYTVQTRIASDLQSPDIEMSPIIEAGSEQAQGMADELAQFFPGRPIITDAQPDALRKLNVIVANEVWMPTDNMLKALDGAVSDGVSLLNNGIGGQSSDPTLARLAGLLDYHFGQTDDAIECTVVADHPILGSLRGLPDLRLRPNGAYGKLPADAVPLIKVADMKLVRGDKSSDPDYRFYPLYVSTLGKGKIISCTFAPYKLVPEVLQFDGRSKFFIRCVRWLADRPVE